MPLVIIPAGSACRDKSGEFGKQGLPDDQQRARRRMPFVHI
jgi:hypothetical protein